MKLLLMTVRGCVLAAIVVLAGSGCASASKRGASSAGGGGTASAPPQGSSVSNSAPASASSPANKAVGHQVVLGSDIRGQISSVNTAGRFVVLSFPVGVMPSNGAFLEVRRSGTPVGELRVTGPQRDTFTVADILKGELKPGDVVAAK